MELSKDNAYKNLFDAISKTYERGKSKIAQTVNSHLVETYWQIGSHIVEFEQGGKQRAEYGKGLIKNLSKDLSFAFGKGFSISNLKRMRQFYLVFPKGATLLHLFTWSHYIELLKIDDPLERSFYEKQCLKENWSIRELIRQKKASLFLRLAASKDKEGILQLAKEGIQIQEPKDILREPYVLDFLQIPIAHQISENELENRIISQLQQFLLELGKGFAFVGRQYKITLGNRHHFVDLVFYNIQLQCYVLIDLKKEEANYEAVGQMNMYLGYFEKEINTPNDKQAIGIILAKEKDDILIEYAMHNISSQLFVSKYQLYLPNKEALRKIVLKQMENE